MKQQTRELQAAHGFITAANNFRQVLGCDGENPVFQCYDDFIGGLASFILCELSMRQAERCTVAGLQRGRAADLRSRALEHNGSGIASLKLATERLRDARKKNDPSPNITRAQRSALNSYIDEFNHNFVLYLVEEEIKPSDLREILDGLKTVSRNARKGPSAILGQLRADLSHLIRLRQRKDRGAETNIPAWKIAGLIVGVGVMYVIYVRCIQQQNCTNQQKAFLVAAGLAGFLLQAACE